MKVPIHAWMLTNVIFMASVHVSLDSLVKTLKVHLNVSTSMSAKKTFVKPVSNVLTNLVLINAKMSMNVSTNLHAEEVLPVSTALGIIPALTSMNVSVMMTSVNPDINVSMNLALFHALI